MEPFVQEYISSTFDDEITEGLLEQTISPYATLRPDNLAAVLRLRPHLLPPIVKTGFNDNRHGDESIPRCQKIWASQEHEDDVSVEECVGDVTLEVVCRGSDTNNSPTEYKVKGLRQHELPVIGICVDKRIVPGFTYNVRRIGANGFLFDYPKTLLSIGMGYGKRLTFASDTFNNNENFFWSDSDPNGYAFSIQAVKTGQSFSILDTDNVIIGEASIQEIIEPQVEVSSIVEDRNITKRVNVNITCSIKYYQRHKHGLIEMMTHEDSELVSGVAVLKKTKSSKKASLVVIEDVCLDRFGPCTFLSDV